MAPDNLTWMYRCRETLGKWGHSPAFWLDAAVKTALVSLLVFGAFSGLQQFEGKAFVWRLATYPLAAFVVPVVWTFKGRRHPYPYAADVLLTLPFLIDVAGNSLDLYDTIVWWDDANHFVNWALLTGGVGALARRTKLGRWELFSILVGFGAVIAILWELSEYLAFIRNSPELATAYADTVGDLALGLAGSFLAAVLFALAPRPQRV